LKNAGKSLGVIPLSNILLDITYHYILSSHQ
jgi:hypothetical protein